MAARDCFKTVEVDDTKYMIEELPPTKSLKLLAKLVKIAGQPLAIASGHLDGKAKDIAPLVLKALVDRLDEDLVLAVVHELAGTCRPLGGDKGTAVPLSGQAFETHFQGRTGHLFKVIRAALEVQYDDFLGVLKNAWDRQQALEKAAQGTLPTVPGSSGA